MSLPSDPLLGPVALTDPGAVGALLASTLAPQTAAPGLRLRYLEHDVGASLLVWYRADLGSHSADVVVSQGRRTWASTPPSEGPGAPGPATGLESAGVARPASVTDEGITVAWYPADPGLPALARDPGAYLPTELRRPEGPWRRLAWMPQQRAVFGAGAVVVKMEAETGRLRAGVRHLDLLRPVVTTPEVLAVDEPAGVYVQRLLAGRPLGPPDALAWAPAAGELAARIIAAGHTDVAGTSDPAARIIAAGHTEAAETSGPAGNTDPGPGSDPGGSWPVPGVAPPDLLAVTVAVRRLAAHAAPELGPRIEQLAARLAASAPPAPPLHLTHGDFNAGQLVALPSGGLGLVDVDTLCRAPAGQDLATYAANLLAGRAGDLAVADAVLAGLLTGFGPAPDELPWLVAVAALRRLDRPIRRYKSNWHQRLDRLLADAETLAARL